MTDRPSRRRVLFVEDESGLRRAYERYFASRYDVLFAETGAQALGTLRASVPDVVVLDLRLPDADGLELLREIRGLQPTLPVIVTTSYTSMQPLIEVLGIDHSGFLLKPFELNDLGARIDATG